MGGSLGSYVLLRSGVCHCNIGQHLPDKLEPSWKHVDPGPGPGPGPAPLRSLPAQDKLAGPKNTERPSGQKASSLSILLRNAGGISSLAKALSVLGVGQGAG